MTQPILYYYYYHYHYYINVCECMCLCELYVHNEAHGSQKRTPDSLHLKLHIAVCH